MAKKFSELVFYPNAKKKNPPEESSGTLDLQNGMPSTVKEEKNSDQMEITHRSGRKEKVKVHMTGSDYHIVKNKDGAQYTVDKKGNVLHGHGNANEEVEIEEGKAGLWANIHAKRKRIKAGSGERMRKPGSEGAPTKAALKASQNEETILEYEIDHDGKGNYRDDEGNEWNSKSKNAPRGSFARKHTITSDSSHAVHINGKKWKSFGSQSHAQNVANKIKGATVHKEEYVKEESDAYDKSVENKRSAEAAKKQGNMFDHHLHMADHHDNLAQYHSEKGRYNVSDSHAKKSEEHHEKAMALKEQTTPTSMQVKQGIGIARDKRYAGGNMTGAVKAMDKVNKGLAQHPAVKKELQKQNEDLELDESGGPVVFKKGNDHIEKYGDDSFAVYKNGKKSKYYKTIDDAKSAINEADDKGEYDYEGQMARTQLQTTMRNCEDLIDMIEDEENMPEWVQSKITLAQDYITTVRDYLQSKEELEESASELNKHVSDFSKGVKSSAAKQSTYKRDGKPIHNMKHVETDSDHQKVFDHLKKMGYKKTGGYDSKPNEFTMHHNRDEMTAKSDSVHHSSGVSAHVEKEHGGKTKVHFTHRNIKEQAPVAPVPDRKYIKGTPEHKAYKATKKPINGHPTNVKEDKKEETMLNFTSFVEALKGNQHKIDKNKNGKVDSHDFKLLRKEETEVVEEARVNGREYASQGVMHPDHAKMDIHKVSNQEVDFYASKTGDKMQGKVLKNDGKEVHIKAHKELGDGKLHKFKVTANLPKNTNEEVEIEENAFDYKSKKSEVSSGRYEIKRENGRTIVTRKYNPDTGMSTGTDDNEPAAKRGRGRPAGSKNRGSAT
jgi:hypothetical protein